MMNKFLALAFLILGCHYAYTEISECNYFQGAECEESCFYENFDVNNKEMTALTGSSNYNSWSTPQDENHDNGCKDTREFWQDKCVSGDCGTSTTCDKFCNKCGADNYLTAKKIVTGKEKADCLETSESYPFTCLKPQYMETVKNNTLMMFIRAASTVCTSTPTEVCVQIKYRRRASAGCPPTHLTKMHVCNSLIDETTNPFNGEFEKECEYLYEATTDHLDNVDPHVAGTPYRHDLNEDTCFNKWLTAEAMFPVDCAASKLNIFTFTVTRGVDHFDIDWVKIDSDACSVTTNMAVDLDGTFLTQ